MTTSLSRHPLWLDRALGDPFADEGPLGFRASVALDEREEFPTRAAGILDDLGVCRHYVPVEHGGDLRSFEELALVLRTIARRDVTLAVGHGTTCLGTQPVFLAGDLALQRSVAACVLRREAFSLGLTEQDNGSDLLATATSADVASRAVTGEKWLIGNATRGAGVTVLARTRSAGGPRGFSLFFVDKEESRGHWDLLPKVHTHGIRGADIGGLRFRAAPYRSEPVGGEGAALSVLLKTFAVTRTLIASVAVGACDSALRIVLDFAKSRKLYGGTVLQIPHARAVLCDSLAEHLSCEAASLAGARALHAAPEEATFWASVLKYHVPTAVERAIRELAIVLGARHYLREAHAFGMFQKIQRDVGVLGLFDGSTLVNLYNVAIHAPVIGRGAREDVPLGGAPALLGALAGVVPGRLSIIARSVSGADALARDALSRLSGRGRANEAVLRPLLEALESESLRVRRHLSADTLRNPFDMTPEIVELASRYARLAAKALAASVHAHAGPLRSPLLDAGDWLVVALARELPQAIESAGGTVSRRQVEACRERLLAFMLEAEQRREPLSLLTGDPLSPEHTKTP
jgi:alkylation response protein AidB-like acyl-CoA dehydrogenase